jgi:hypothetical protein
MAIVKRLQRVRGSSSTPRESQAAIIAGESQTFRATMRHRTNPAVSSTLALLSLETHRARPLTIEIGAPLGK